MFKVFSVFLFSLFSSVAFAAPSCEVVSDLHGKLKGVVVEYASGEKVLTFESGPPNFQNSSVGVTIQFLRVDQAGWMPVAAARVSPHMGSIGTMSQAWNHQTKQIMLGGAIVFDFQEEKVNVECFLGARKIFQVVPGDDTLSHMIARWGREHKYEIYWNASFDLPILGSTDEVALFNADIENETDFRSVLRRVISSLRNNNRIAPLKICMFEDKKISIHTLDQHECKTSLPSVNTGAPVNVGAIQQTVPPV